MIFKIFIEDRGQQLNLESESADIRDSMDIQKNDDNTYLIMNYLNDIISKLQSVLLRVTDRDTCWFGTGRRHRAS